MNRSALPLPTLLVVACMMLPHLTGCASSTRIISEPEDADVYVDNINVGKTPLVYTEGSVWFWTSHVVRLTKKGYEPVTESLEARVSPGMVVLGVVGLVCLFPAVLILVGEYKPEYHFVMKRAAGEPSAVLRESSQIDFRQ